MLSAHYLLWLLENLFDHLYISASSPQFHWALWSAFSLLRKFLHSLTPPHHACCIPLRSVQDTTPCGVLPSCGCSLTLSLTTSIGIWDSAGATKSWSSDQSLSCFCRSSLYIRSNYDSGGWATQIIHLRSLVFGCVHSPDPPRNHQCCYQGPFFSTSNWRQGHIQRYISCCHSNKACKFIATDSVQN